MARRRSRKESHPDQAAINLVSRDITTEIENSIRRSVLDDEEKQIAEREAKEQPIKTLVKEMAKLTVARTKLEQQILKLQSISPSAENTDRARALTSIKTATENIETEYKKALKTLESSLESLVLSPEVKTIIQDTLKSRTTEVERAHKEVKSSLRKKEDSFETRKEAKDFRKENPLLEPKDLLGKLQELAKKDPDGDNYLRKDFVQLSLSRHTKELAKLESDRTSFLQQYEQALAKGEMSVVVTLKTKLERIISRSSIIQSSLERWLGYYKNPPKAVKPLSERSTLKEDAFEIKDPVERVLKNKALSPDEKRKEAHEAMIRQVGHCLDGSKERMKFRQEQLASSMYLPHENPHLLTKFPYPKGFGFTAAMRHLGETIANINKNYNEDDNLELRKLKRTFEQDDETVRNAMAEFKALPLRRRLLGKPAPLKKMIKDHEANKKRITKLEKKLSNESRQKSLRARKSLYEGWMTELREQQMAEKRSEALQKEIVQLSKDLAEHLKAANIPESEIKETAQNLLTLQINKHVLLINPRNRRDRTFKAVLLSIRRQIQDKKEQLAVLGKASEEDLTTLENQKQDLRNKFVEAFGERAGNALMDSDIVLQYLRSIVPNENYLQEIIQALNEHPTLAIAADDYPKLRQMLKEAQPAFSQADFTLRQHLPTESLESPETDKEFFLAAKQWFEHSQQYYEKAGEEAQHLYKVINDLFTSTPLTALQENQLLTACIALEEFLKQKLGAHYPKLPEYIAASTGAETNLLNMRARIAQEQKELKDQHAYRNFKQALFELRSVLESVQNTEPLGLTFINNLLSLYSEEAFQKKIIIELPAGSDDDGVERGISKGSMTNILLIMKRCIGAIESIYQQNISNLPKNSEPIRKLRTVLKTIGLSFYTPFIESKTEYTEQEQREALYKREVLPVLADIKSAIESIEDGPDQELALELYKKLVNNLPNETTSPILLIDQGVFDAVIAPIVVELSTLLDETGKNGDAMFSSLLAKLNLTDNLDLSSVKNALAIQVDEVDNMAEERFTFRKEAFLNAFNNPDNPFFIMFKNLADSNDFDEWADTTPGNVNAQYERRRRIIDYAIQYREHELKGRFNPTDLSGTGGKELKELAESLALSNYLLVYESEYLNDTPERNNWIELMDLLKKDKFADAAKINDLNNEFLTALENAPHHALGLIAVSNEYYDKALELRESFFENKKTELKDGLIAAADAVKSNLTSPGAEITLDRASLSPKLLPKLDTAIADLDAGVQKTIIEKIAPFNSEDAYADLALEVEANRVLLIGDFQNEIADIHAENEVLKEIKTFEDQIEIDLKELIDTPTTLSGDKLIIASFSDHQKNLLKEYKETLDTEAKTLITSLSSDRTFSRDTAEEKWDTLVDNYKRSISELSEGHLPIAKAFNKLKKASKPLFDSEASILDMHTETNINAMLSNDKQRASIINQVLDHYLDELEIVPTYDEVMASAYASELSSYVSAMGYDLKDFFGGGSPTPRPPEPKPDSPTTSTATSEEAASTKTETTTEDSSLSEGEKAARIFNEFEDSYDNEATYEEEVDLNAQASTRPSLDEIIAKRKDQPDDDAAASAAAVAEEERPPRTNLAA